MRYRALGPEAPKKTPESPKKAQAAPDKPTKYLQDAPPKAENCLLQTHSFVASTSAVADMRGSATGYFCGCS